MKFYELEKIASSIEILSSRLDRARKSLVEEYKAWNHWLDRTIQAVTDGYSGWLPGAVLVETKLGIYKVSDTWIFTGERLSAAPANVGEVESIIEELGKLDESLLREALEKLVDYAYSESSL